MLVVSSLSHSSFSIEYSTDSSMPKRFFLPVPILQSINQSEGYPNPPKIISPTRTANYILICGADICISIKDKSLSFRHYTSVHSCQHRGLLYRQLNHSNCYFNTFEEELFRDNALLILVLGLLSTGLLSHLEMV